MQSKGNTNYPVRIVFENVRDFNPVHIFECGQVFRWKKTASDAGELCTEYVKTYENTSGGCNTCEYTGFAGEYAAIVSYASSGTLIVEASGGSREFWRDYFDLATDYATIKRELTLREPGIETAVEYGYGIRILNQNLFETLISFIISQNNNIPRIKKCIEALCENYGEPIVSHDSGDIIGHAFPTRESLANAELSDLAELRLGYRGPYIKACAERCLDEGMPTCRDDLLKMYGIGPKVANCIMLFGLRDVAAFPIDTWVKHIMNDMYGFDEKDVKGMQNFASDKFGAYAGYAQQYLFYYYRDRG